MSTEIVTKRSQDRDWWVVKLLCDERWILRRHDRVEFVSDVAVARRTRVDFSTDWWFNPPNGPFLPLFVVPKDSRGSWGYRLSDNRGRTLAWCSAEERRQDSAAALVRLAGQVFTGSPGGGEALPEPLRDLAVGVAMSPPEQARLHLGALRSSDSPLAEVEFMRLAELLAVGSIAVVQPSDDVQVVELSYEQTVDSAPSGLLSRGLRHIGWHDVAAPLTLTRPFASANELEVRAPPNTELSSLEISPRPGTDGWGARASGPAPVLWLNVPSDSPTSQVTATAALSPSGAMVKRALGAAVVAALVLTGAWIWADRIARSDTAAPVLVLLAAAALPALIASMSSPHQMSERLFGPARVLLFGVAAAGFVAAARVAVIPETARDADGAAVWLFVAAVVAWVCVVVLATARHRLARRRMTAWIVPAGQLRG